MAKFTYIARDRNGEKIEGSLEVEDLQAVRSQLQTMGYFPVKIQDVTPKSRPSLSLSSLRGKVGSKELVSFNRQLADLVSAGVPLVKSLGIILKQTKDEKLHSVISDINKAVQGGDTMAQALQRHPKTFDNLAVAMVRAGETGGMLDEVLERLANYSEAEEELKGKVISSLAYPMVMVVAGIVVIAILLVVVIPKITGVYTSLGQELPAITTFLIVVTNAIARFWWVLPPAVIGAVVLFKQFVNSKEGRYIYHSFLFRIPVLGEVIQKRELALFARTLGNLLHNGVPILQALEITEQVVTNSVVLREVKKLSPAVSQGASMASTMAESDVFPDIMVSMTAVGEETAQVDGILMRVSDTYEAQVERSLKTLTSLIEPLIILVLGLVVGFVVIAMLLPIMNLDPTVGE